MNLLFLGKENFKKIVPVLVKLYPAMFKYDPNSNSEISGYGLGGAKGMKDLAGILTQRVRMNFQLVFTNHYFCF